MPEKQLTSEKQPVSKQDFDDDAEDEEKGYAASKPASPSAADRKGIPLLAALDDPLVAVLRSGATSSCSAPNSCAPTAPRRCCPSSSAGKSWSGWRRSGACKFSSRRLGLAGPPRRDRRVSGERAALPAPPARRARGGALLGVRRHPRPTSDPVATRVGEQTLKAVALVLGRRTLWSHVSDRAWAVRASSQIFDRVIWRHDLENGH